MPHNSKFRGVTMPRDDGRALERVPSHYPYPQFCPLCRRLLSGAGRRNQSPLHGERGGQSPAVSQGQGGGLGHGGIFHAAALHPYPQLSATPRKPNGRTIEIQRLSRPLPAFRRGNELPWANAPSRWTVTCLQADGGTRTAAISGAFVALVEALAWMKGEGLH